MCHLPKAADRIVKGLPDQGTIPLVGGVSSLFDSIGGGVQTGGTAFLTGSGRDSDTSSLRGDCGRCASAVCPVRCLRQLGAELVERQPGVGVVGSVFISVLVEGVLQAVEDAGGT